MPLLVMKFGGTSVADLERIKNAAQKVRREVERGYDVIVIVSAMSGKTNELVGWVEATSPLFDAREYDAIVASGELVTAGLLAIVLQSMGIMEFIARSANWVPRTVEKSTRSRAGQGRLSNQRSACFWPARCGALSIMVMARSPSCSSSAPARTGQACTHWPQPVQSSG